MSSQSVAPGRRTCGFSNRRSFRMSCSSDDPFGQSVPRLMGWSGSPSTCSTCGMAFLALSPIVNDDAAAHGAIRTGAARFAGAGNFERRSLGVNRSEIKAEGGESGSAQHGAFEKSPARELHFLVAPDIA